MTAPKNIFIRLALAALLPSILAPAAEDRKPSRIALVTGIDRCETAVGPLRNTGNDVKAMATTLRTPGFTVMEWNPAPQ